MVCSDNRCSRIGSDGRLFRIMRPAQITAGAGRMQGILPIKDAGYRRKPEGGSKERSDRPNLLIYPEKTMTATPWHGPSRGFAAAAAEPFAAAHFAVDRPQ